MTPVYNDLRSIIQTYGTELSLNPKLCDAFLSDLLPQHPKQRKVLVTAVKAEITSLILNNKKIKQSSRQQQRFESPQQRKWAIDTWYYALKGEHRLSSQFNFIGRNKYKGIASIIGLIALISFLLIFTHYKSNNKQITIENPHLANEKANIVIQKKLSNLPTSAPKTPLTTSDEKIPAIQNNTSSLPQKQEQIQTKPTKKSINTTTTDKLKPHKNTLPKKFTLKTKSIEKRPVVKARPKTPHTNITTTPSSIKKTKQQHSEILPQYSLAEKEALLLMQEAIISSVALHRETTFIEKKKQDIQELTKLFKLTKDRYYQQQIYHANQKLDILNKNYNRLSTEYKNKLSTICYIQSHIIKRSLQKLQNNYRNSSAIKRTAYFRLIQHLKNCP